MLPVAIFAVGRYRRAISAAGTAAPVPALTNKVLMVEPIPVSALFESHLTVSELPRSVAFYRDVVALQLASEAHDVNAALLWIAAPGDATLGLWEDGSARVGLTLHLL